MKYVLLFVFLFSLTLPAAAQKVLSLKIDGAINPVAAAYIHRGIKQAEQTNAACLLIHLNTPGGLLKSTRVIVSDMLEAPVPVVVYVAPGGAHAGSAGVFLTLAAHIAAMAPGTNIGAAHPVNMQGGMDSVMGTKATNDAVAFIRSIAEKRGRNIKWAEEAVRNSVSVSETEAVAQEIIDLVAPNTAELLRLIDGKKVQVGFGTVTLNTENAAVETLELSWAEKLLDLISDPNIAYILMMLGFYGLLFELYNPGAILPGIVGVVSLILAFYALHTLPINYAGLALIVFSLVLFLLEIKVVSHGLLAIGGVISLFLGSIMLIRDDSIFPIVAISRSVIIASVGLSALFFLFVLGAGLQAQKAQPVSGAEGMVGDIGEALEELNPGGTVLVHGEIWQAEAVAAPIEKGAKVRVIALNDLKVQVERAASAQQVENAGAQA